MEQTTGNLLVRVYTSRAQIPVDGATVTITQPGTEGKQKVLALEITNQSGLTRSISLPAPPRALSDEPGNQNPFAVYDVWAEHPTFELLVVRDVQVFTGVETIQDMSLVPLPEHATTEEDARSTLITPQPL